MSLFFIILYNKTKRFHNDGSVGLQIEKYVLKTMTCPIPGGAPRDAMEDE